MVKTIKYIIKRILIGVGIALILYFCRNYIFLQVHAESRVIYPNNNSLRIYRDTGSSYAPTQTSFTKPAYGNVTWYGVNGTLTPNFTWNLATMSYDISRLTKKGYYDFDFMVLSGFSGSLEEDYTFSIYTNSGYNVCTTNDSNTINPTDYTEVPKYVVNVSCDNIYIDISQSTDFILYAYLNDSTRYNEWFATTVLNSNYLPNNANNQMVQAVEETNNILKDASIDSNKTDNDINTMNSKIASNGTITQLLTLPITLYQSVLNSLNGACSPINLGTLYNHTLNLPCINLSNLLGGTLYNIIDILLCGVFILTFRKKMVDIFNHMTSLKDRGNELE